MTLMFLYSFSCFYWEEVFVRSLQLSHRCTSWLKFSSSPSFCGPVLQQSQIFGCNGTAWASGGPVGSLLSESWPHVPRQRRKIGAMRASVCISSDVLTVYSPKKWVWRLSGALGNWAIFDTSEACLRLLVYLTVLVLLNPTAFKCKKACSNNCLTDCLAWDLQSQRSLMLLESNRSWVE